MKISIITVCYNSVDTILQCIKSVSSQNYDDIEHIIIDGVSNDGTINVVEANRDIIDQFISESDNGIYDAMNKGIAMAKGDVIAILNADDFYASVNVISKMVEFMEYQELDAAYGDLVYVDCNDTSKEVRFWQAGSYKTGAFRNGWVPPHPTFFCRKQIFEKYGYFNKKFKVAGDFELLLRFIEKYQIKVGYLPKVIVKMRTGGKANVLRGIIRGNCEIVRSFRLNGLHLSPWFFIVKPITKISQLFTRPSKRYNENVNL